MIDKTVTTAAAAVADIGDNSTVMIGGFGSAGMPSELVDALIAQGARDLTIVSNNAGNGELGLAALLKTKRVRKIICSFPRQTDSYVFDALLHWLEEGSPGRDQEFLELGGPVEVRHLLIGQERLSRAIDAPTAVEFGYGVKASGRAQSGERAHVGTAVKNWSSKASRNSRIWFARNFLLQSVKYGELRNDHRRTARRSCASYHQPS